MTVTVEAAPRGRPSDPATWARDVGDLVRRGWELGEVTPHDFYPQTSHVEVVSVLTRSERPERLDVAEE